MYVCAVCVYVYVCAYVCVRACLRVHLQKKIHQILVVDNKNSTYRRYGKCIAGAENVGSIFGGYF